MTRVWHRWRPMAPANSLGRPCPATMWTTSRASQTGSNKGLEPTALRAAAQPQGVRQADVR